MRWARLMGVAAALALLGATGCGDDNGDGGENGAAESTATTTDEVVAVELTAGGECTLSDGTVATGVFDVSVTNNSDEPIYVALLLIDEGTTLDEVQATVDAQPELLTQRFVGGTPDLTAPEGTTLSAVTDIDKAAPPGGEATDTFGLTEAGEYAVACLTEDEPAVLASETLVVEG